jgi:DNA-binding transcriptional LysR family regulator
MRLVQLHHLVEAAKYNSISLAAERSYISQPAISLSISKLEAELGMVLLERTKHGVYPTADGEIIIAKAKQVLNIIEEMKQQTTMTALKGRISVATIPSMCDKILPMVLSDLKTRHPKIDLILTQEESIDVMQSIQSGKADIGVVILTDEIKDEDICIDELFSDEFVIYVGKNSPLASKKSISLKEALKHSFVAYNNEFNKNKGGITSLLRKHGLPKVSLRLDSFQMIKRVVSQGLDIAFFLEFMSKDDVYLQSGEIRPIQISDVNLSVTVGLIWLKEHSLSPTEKEFINTLRTVCNSVVND